MVDSNSVEDVVKSVNARMRQIVAEEPLLPLLGRFHVEGEDGSEFKFSSPNPMLSPSKVPVMEFVNDDDDDGNGDESGDNEEEEEEDIKFSHVLNQEQVERNLTINLKSHFLDIKRQFDEYQSRYTKLSKDLSKLRDRAVTAEISKEDVEEEVVRLKEELEYLRGEAPSTAGGNYAGGWPGRKKPRGNYKNLQDKSDEIRRALLKDDEDEHEILMEDLLKSRDFSSFLKGVSNTISSIISNALPFKHDIEVVEARLGASVASYFTFSRFIFLHMSCIALLMLVFGFYHLIVLRREGSGLYDMIVSHGDMPAFMLYSSFAPKEGRRYSMVVLGSVVITVLLLLAKVVREDLQAKKIIAVDSKKDKPFSKEVLAIWDMGGATTFARMDIRRSELSLHLGTKLYDTKVEGLVKQRSIVALLILYLRRVVGITLFLAVMVISFAAIVYITLSAAALSTQAEGAGLGRIAFLIPPLVLTGINSSMPTLLEYITHLEKWDSSTTHINLLLLRQYISSTFNSVLLAFTYLLLADRFAFASFPAIKNSLTPPDDESYKCNLDQTTGALFNLVFVTWVLRMLGILTTPLSNYLFYMLLQQDYEPDEFKVAEQIVALFSFLGLVFILLPFAPLMVVFLPPALYIGLKWEKFWIKRLYAPPRRPWKAQRAGYIFSVFYLITYALMGGASLLFFFVTQSFQKDCDIQDEAIGLCVVNTYDPASQTCIKDEGSKYYKFFENDLYPKVVCEDACGPFIGDRSNWIPVLTAVESNFPLRIIWSMLFHYPYIPWLIIIFIFFNLATAKNTQQINDFINSDKINSLEIGMEQLEKERRKQESMVKKLKAIDGE